MPNTMIGGFLRAAHRGPKKVNPGNKRPRRVLISCDLRVQHRGIAVMSEIRRHIVRSGGYALLATAFVLGCSLLMTGEETGRQSAQWSGPTQFTSLVGSADHSPPDLDAGQ
jgi:hypothetical protein